MRLLVVALFACFALSVVAGTHEDTFSRLRRATTGEAADAVFQDVADPAAFYIALSGAHLRTLPTVAVDALFRRLDLATLDAVWAREGLREAASEALVESRRVRKLDVLTSWIRIARTATYDRRIDAWVGGQIADQFGFYSGDLELLAWNQLTAALREIRAEAAPVGERTMASLLPALREVLSEATFRRSLNEEHIGYLFYDLRHLALVAEETMLLIEDGRFKSLRVKRGLREAVGLITRFLLQATKLARRPDAYYKERFGLGLLSTHFDEEPSAYATWDDLTETQRIHRARRQMVTVASLGGPQQLEFFAGTHKEATAAVERALTIALRAYERTFFPEPQWLTPLPVRFAMPYLALSLSFLQREAVVQRMSWTYGLTHDRQLLRDHYEPLAARTLVPPVRHAWAETEDPLPPLYDVTVEISEAKQIGVLVDRAKRHCLLFLPASVQDRFAATRTERRTGSGRPGNANAALELLLHDDPSAVRLPIGAWVATGRIAKFVPLDERIVAVAGQPVTLYTSLRGFLRASNPMAVLESLPKEPVTPRSLLPTRESVGGCTEAVVTR